MEQILDLNILRRSSPSFYSICGMYGCVSVCVCVCLCGVVCVVCVCGVWGCVGCVGVRGGVCVGVWGVWGVCVCVCGGWGGGGGCVCVVGGGFFFCVWVCVWVGCCFSLPPVSPCPLSRGVCPCSFVSSSRITSSLQVPSTPLPLSRPPPSSFPPLPSVHVETFRVSSAVFPAYELYKFPKCLFTLPFKY